MLRYSKFMGKPDTTLALLGRPFAMRGGTNPFPADDDYLQRVLDWRSNAIATVNPGNYEVPEPADDSEWDEWDWNRSAFIRGLTQDDWILNYLKGAIEFYGLDVTLRIPALPFDDSTTETFLHNWQDRYHAIWTDEAYNLIQIYTDHGPSWVEFVASNYQTPNHHHISLCNSWELWDWYKYLWKNVGPEVADNAAVQWWTKYKVIRARYDGKRARLKGKLTRGLTLSLNEDSRVDGLHPPYIVWDGFSGSGYDVVANCDPDVHYVHTLPGSNFQMLVDTEQGNSAHYKSLQHMHVSLLI